jgi:hypothetical protein
MLRSYIERDPVVGKEYYCESTVNASDLAKVVFSSEEVR